MQPHKRKVVLMFCCSSNGKREQMWPIRGLRSSYNEASNSDANFDFLFIKILFLIFLLHLISHPPLHHPSVSPLPALPASCLFIFLSLPSAVSVLQTVLVSAGQCDSVFKGFSDCLLQLGENMANYPQDLDDRENLHKICRYVVVMLL